MEIFIVFLLFALGFLFIIKGGDWFVDASEWIAELTGIPHFIVGATIVSLATTLPELFVSVNATLSGSPDIAIGNAVGSTICNIGLISGLIIFIIPSEVNSKTYLKKGLLLSISVLTFLLLAYDLVLTKSEALILYFLLAVFIYLNIQIAKDSTYIENHEIDKSRKAKIKNALMFIFGAIFIIIGADLLVDNGIKIARYFSVPESFIALTLVAVGTSLPELVTAISSIIKKKHHIGLGNIIGANVLNYLLILSTSSMISDNGLIINTRNFEFLSRSFTNYAQTLKIDVPVSFILVLIMILPPIFKKKTYRIQGFIILSSYILYLILLVNISL